MSWAPPLVPRARDAASSRSRTAGSSSAASSGCPVGSTRVISHPSRPRARAARRASRADAARRRGPTSSDSSVTCSASSLVSASRRCWKSVVSVGDASIQRGESAAPGLVECGPGEHGHAVAALEQIRGLGVERGAVARRLECLDAGEEPRVEADRVAMGREARRELGLDRVDLIVGDRRSSHSRRRQEYPAQQGSGPFERDDRVLERRGRGVDARSPRPRARCSAHAVLDRLTVVLGADEGEQRKSVRAAGSARGTGCDCPSTHPSNPISHVARMAEEPRLEACTPNAPRRRTARCLHARPPRERAAHPLVAHGRELRRIPRTPPA